MIQRTEEKGVDSRYRAAAGQDEAEDSEIGRSALLLVRPGGRSKFFVFRGLMALCQEERGRMRRCQRSS